MDLDRTIAEFARTHHGLTHRSWLRDHKVPRGVLEAHLRMGRLESPYVGVYRVAGAPITWRTNVLAACWAGGVRAVASHRSAAALWDLPGQREEIAEIMCPRWRRARHDGLVLHETKLLGSADTTEVDGIPVTMVERTLVDLGAVCSPPVVEMALDNALRRELVTHRSVFTILDRIGKQGRNGVGVLRQILRERDLGEQPTESPKETELLRLIRNAGLPMPSTQVDIRHRGRFVARVDFAYPDARLVIEYDSRSHHVGVVEMERDSARRNLLVAADMTVLVATQRDLSSGGRALCDAIRSHLRRFGVAQPAI
jgi:very-short-patch-repair endonuclease